MGTLAYYQHALGVLQSTPGELVERCLNGTESLMHAYRPGNELEGLIIDLGDGGGVGDASSELVELLIRLRNGLDDIEVMDILSNMGVSESDARDLLQSLVEEGLLIDTMD